MSSFTNWRYRRFVLTSLTLQYFTEEGESKGIIPRASILVAEEVDLDELPHRRGSLTSRFLYPMRVWVRRTPFYICFENPQERSSWIRLLSHRRLSLWASEMPYWHTSMGMDNRAHSAVVEASYGGSAPLFTPPTNRTREDKRRDSYDLALLTIDLPSDSDEEEEASFSEDSNAADGPGSEERFRLLLSDLNQLNLQINQRTQQQSAVSKGKGSWIAFGTSVRQSIRKSNQLGGDQASLQWNERYQRAFEELFSISSLRQLHQERRCLSQASRASMRTLESVEEEFSYLATSLFVSWVHSNPPGPDKALQSFSQQGIRFLLPSSLQTADEFRHSSRRQFAIMDRCRGEISRFYYEYGQREGEIPTDRAEAEKVLEDLRFKLFHLQEDPLGSHREEGKIMEEQISFIQTGRITSGPSSLPLYFPLWTIVEYLGIPAIATVDISWRKPNKAPHPAKAAALDFLTRIFIHLVPEGAKTNNDLCMEGVDNRLYFQVDALSLMSQECPLNPIALQRRKCTHHAPVTKEHEADIFIEHALPQLSSYGTPLQQLLELHCMYEHLPILFARSHRECHRNAVLVEMIAQVISIEVRNLFWLECSSLLECIESWKGYCHSMSQPKWWDHLEIHRLLMETFQVTYSEVCFEGLEPLTITKRVRQLIGGEVIGQDAASLQPLVKTLPRFTFFQAIPPSRCHSVAEQCGLEENLKILQHSIGSQYGSHAVGLMQQSLVLWGLARELLDSCNSLPLIYATLCHCRKSLDRVLMFQPGNILAHIHRGSVQAEISSFLIHYSGPRAEEDNDVTPEETMINGLRFFQNAAFLSMIPRGAVSPLQFIGDEEADRLLMSQWGHYLSEAKSYILSYRADIHNMTPEMSLFQLSCWQLHLSGHDPFSFCSIEGAIQDVRGFVEYLFNIILECTNQGIRQSAILCLILLSQRDKISIHSLLAEELIAPRVTILTLMLSTDPLCPPWAIEIVNAIQHLINGAGFRVSGNPTE